MWAIGIKEVEDLCREIEKDLYMAGQDLAVSKVRSAFARPRKAIFVDQASVSFASELTLIDSDGVVPGHDSDRSV